ncbi:MAG: phospho-N-acetylmuramoyl-pentapeptide-transferase [Clostridiales bacterium]|nr:phospho-N-acetylmuramoyl-pentapeptide-transferase [Clostridiales bacterium]
MLQKYIFTFLITFLLALLFAPLVFLFSKKLKAKQTILHYVKEHEGKQGTPTMGGIIFILPAIIVSLLFFTTDYMLAIITLAVFFGYALLGFLDDFIKVRFKQNLGLRAYQKVLGQLAISLIIAIFVYNSVGTEINIPFSNISVDLGFWIIPLVIITYIATVNSVNLIDGLDGLCSVSSINYLFFFSIILMVTSAGLNGIDMLETQNIIISNFSILGALFAFLFFNSYPAKIFMGDTGSLGLGGYIASVSILTKNILLIPILGLVFVITSLSDIIQVLHFKRTKKRIFKMAPLHHHFQMSGVHENKVTFSYFLFSFILNLIVVAFYII